MFWLSRITEHSTFAGGMLGPELVLGAGLGPLFVLIFLVGLTKVSNDDAGVASSLVNVGQQVGGSIGLAVVGTVAGSAVASSLRSRPPRRPGQASTRPVPGPPRCRPAWTTTRWPPGSPAATWSRRAPWRSRCHYLTKPVKRPGRRRS